MTESRDMSLSGVCPHGRHRPGPCAECDWEMAADRKLDELTDEQLIYLTKSLAVTLDDRGWWFDRGKNTWRNDDA